MATYHFCFDLNYYGLFRIPQNFYLDPFWIVQRTCIVSLFLLCAGAGQVIAVDASQSWARFFRRWSQVAACAGLVSIGSALMFPASWISFGVLHGLAVMLLLGRLTAPRGASPSSVALLVGLGAVAVVLPAWIQSTAFDSRWTNWVGLVTHKPQTEDWVPLLPWTGVMLWGMAAGKMLLARRRAILAGPVPPLLQPLAVLGRWSLAFYMLHQVVLIGALEAGRRASLW